jgi:HEAT repeat protein
MLFRFRKIILLVIILAITGSLYGWWRRDDLVGWYCFEQLSQADGGQREIWVNRLIEMDEAILPRALECLAERSCSDGEEVLIALVKKWKDARTVTILKEMLARWSSFTEPGKNCALNIARVALEETGEQSPIGFLCTLARDIVQCGVSEAKNGRATLFLAAVLLRLEPKEMPHALMASLAEQGLRSPDFDLRVQALRFFLQPPLNTDGEFLGRVVPFLKDVSADVRRVALLAVGSNTDLATEDDLLPLLHDADAEVSRLCEVALRSRGLSDQHIILARLISDERPMARLEVLEYLHQARDLAPGVWLRRLCQDLSPAVRAAAIRTAAYYDVVDLRDRLREMAQNDASPTVRQLAGHYLRRGMMR